MTYSSAAIDNLYPALAECFVIIICGYFAGRINLVSETGSKGINTFVGTFSLPSLICVSLARLDLSTVNWMFLASVFIAKSIVFFSVIIITILVGRPINLGRAGIFAIFCTQGNDFAIGYPIVAALYKDSHPEFASYLYLVAPVNLAILNPVAYILLEIGKQRTDNEPLLSVNDSDNVRRKRRCMLVVSIIKSIFTNPIAAMTILGILGNLIFKHRIPLFITDILDAFGSAFTASALFLLGLQMVGKLHKLRGPTLIVPGILIIVKLLVFPLLIREVVSLLGVGANATETVDWSTYAFLYGTIPAAPTVFLFATHYNLDIDLIATAIVICTFVSAPLMYISAKMITLTNTDPGDYIAKLKAFTFDVSIAGLIASMWIITVFCITKRINRIPHRITTCLVFSQFLTCLGAILWNCLNEEDEWLAYLQFALTTTGVYSARIWTSFLAITLLLFQCKNLCYVLKLQPLFVIVGWGLPITLSTLFLLLDKENSVAHDKRNPNVILYGAGRAVEAVLLLTSCFIITASCLILTHRYSRHHSRYLDLAEDVRSTFNTSASSEGVDNTTSAPCQGDSCRSSVSGLPAMQEGCCQENTDGPIIDVDDLLTGPPAIAPGSGCCQDPHRDQCRDLIEQYHQQINDDVELIEEEPDSHDPQFFQHFILLILLLYSMFVGLGLSIWTLVTDQMSGVYVEVEFLESALNFGQSIIVFAIFVTNTKEVTLPLLDFWRKLWYGANQLNLPSCHELSSETKSICDQFTTHHLQKCKDQIAKDKRWRMKVYKNVFSGRNFSDWLIEVGLARDRSEAVNYAQHLIEGRVLKHINGVYHFHDRNLLYEFHRSE